MTYLILSTHPDDETWGCGGSMARWVHDGHRVLCWLATCPGESQRIHEFRTVCAHLGTTCLGRSEPAAAQDGTLSRAPDLVARLDRMVRTHAVDVVLAPCWSCHLDHQTLHQAAKAMARPHRYSGSLLFYPAGFEKQDDGACCYMDITDVAPQKYTALECYHTQIHSGSLDMNAVMAADRVNGFRCGVTAAEIFVPYRYRLG